VAVRLAVRIARKTSNSRKRVNQKGRLPRSRKKIRGFCLSYTLKHKRVLRVTPVDEFVHLPAFHSERSASYLSCRVASISSIPTLPWTHSRFHVDLVPSPTYAPPSNSFMLRRVTAAASLSAAGATRFMPTGPFQPAGGATTGQKKKSGKGERFKDPQIRARERTPDGRSPRSGGPHNIIQKGRSRSIRSSKK
jgi:hypothetical protein